MMASSIKPNLPESQEYKRSSEENIPASKEEEAIKKENSYVNMANALNLSDSLGGLETSPQNSEDWPEMLAERNLSAVQEEEAIKKENSYVNMADVLNSSDSLGGLETSAQSSIENVQQEMLSEENLKAVKTINESQNIRDIKMHRQNDHYSSESDLSDVEADDSSSSDGFSKNLHKNMLPPQLPVLTTKGEILPEDLPPVEDLDINVNDIELEKIGAVLHNVISEERNEYLVVVQADGNSNPIDEDSVLFLSSSKPLGKVYDTFGNVNRPSYTVRFNNAQDIYDKAVTSGQDVYYLPDNDEHTHYVLVDALKQQKGSDASWKDNNEPPDDKLDYSDDEKEKRANRKKSAKNRRKDRNWNEEGEDMVAKKNAAYNQDRAFLVRPSRNRFQSSAASTSRSTPRSYSPHSLISTPPPFDMFGSGLQRNSNSSQLFRHPAPAFLQRSVPSPQTFRPFSHSNVSSPQTFKPFSHSNVPSSQSFGPSPQPFGTLPHSNGPSPQPFGTLPHSNGPSLTFASFLHRNGSSYQHFTAPPPNVSESLNFATGSPLIAPSQINVPLQQQQVTSFLSGPPPNYNSNQISRSLVHQNQPFQPPLFGAPPAVGPAMQNISHQSSSNQILLPFGSSCPTNLSGNNIPINSNGLQGQSYGMAQFNSSNSFLFPTNSQQNNVFTQITHPVFVPNQSTPPFVPPPIVNPQGTSILFNSLRQTPPSTIHPVDFSSPVPPQNYPYC